MRSAFLISIQWLRNLPVLQFRSYNHSSSSLFKLVSALLFITLITSTTFAQTLFFSTLTTRNGLPSNIINSVTQDNDNFIWVATGNGLSRYDGYHFKVFKNDETLNSIPSNDVTCLLVDGDFLWVGTRRGLCKINTHTFEITRIKIQNAVYIRSFYKDRDNSVWIGTLTGLFNYSPTTHQFKSYTAEKNNLSHNTVRSLYQDKEGNLWVGTYDQLNKLTPGSEIFQSFDLKGNYKPQLKNNLVCDIKPVQASDSLIWVGTETGLCQFNTKTNHVTHYNASNTSFSNEVIKNIHTDKEGNLWLGTDFGLNLFDTKTKQNKSFFHNPEISYSIANNAIWEIFESRDGVLWFVTFAGLSKMNFNFYDYHEITHSMENQTIGGQVRSLIVTKKGIIWMATLHGVIRFDPSTNKKRIFNINSSKDERIVMNNVYTLEEDDKERIWIGTAGGLNVWDERQQKMHSITANNTNGLLTNYTSDFTQGLDGSFWVSFSDAGLFKLASGYEDLKDVRFEFVTELEEANVYASNSLWTIHQNNLYRIDTKTYSLNRIKSFSAVAKGKNIDRIYYALQGSLWAGTHNGLIEYNPQTDTTLFHPVVTGDNIDISNVISDEHGNIWATANNFILKFDISDHHISLFPLDKELPLKTFASFAAKNAMHEVIFGGDNGFISLSTRIRPDTYQPDIYVTSIEINNKPVDPNQKVDDEILLFKDITATKELTLEYHQRSIAFEFSALHYWQPDMNVYSYMLEGFDKDWNYASGRKNFAVYSNLSPGTYHLKVKGTNNYGIWSDHVASIKIIVKPHLFLSPPFLLLYTVLLVAIIIIAFRIYLTRVHLKNELKIALIEKDHAEEIMQTKQQFFTNISHELRTPISLIIPPIQQAIKSGRLDEENKSLLTLAEKKLTTFIKID